MRIQSVAWSYQLYKPPSLNVLKADVSMLTLELAYFYRQYMGGKLLPLGQHLHLGGKRTVKEAILKLEA